MNVNCSVIGSGTIIGSGTHSQGDVVTLSAEPTSGYVFSRFKIGNTIIAQNPYVFEASDSDVEISAVFIVTIESYLKASIGFEIPDAALMKIQIDRGWVSGVDVSLVDVKVRDLSYADLLMLVANMPSQVQGIKDTDMYWGHQAANITLKASDKSALTRAANFIYRKYGEPLPEPTVKLIALNGTKSDANARY